jgi:hypothetical protein
MGASARATKRAGGLYRRTFDALRHPVRKIEAEAHHLLELEEAGESGETPFIAILGVILFLLPIFALMLAIILSVYYLAGG